MKSGLCIYHANCNDGFAAALAVWRKYGNKWDYIPMQYGDDINIENLLTIGDNKVMKAEFYPNIMLVDFSLPRDYMIGLSRLTNLLVIDHHKTAMEACEGLDFCKFDLSKSGCELTWEHLFPDEPIPHMFELIGYRDIGKTFDESNSDCKLFRPAKILYCGLSMYQREFHVWEDILNNERGMLDTVKSDGLIVLTLQERQVRNFVDRWKDDPKMIQILNYNVPIANCCDLISERIGALSEGRPFAIGYFDTSDKRVFNLRTRRDDVDCSAIAKSFGGGGHPSAAGFSIPFKGTGLDIKNLNQLCLGS